MERTGPDWRDRTAYQPLLDADRSMFAWEWLRRDPRYRSACVGALSAGSSDRSCAGQFGLVAWEAPDAGVPDARPLWRFDDHPYVLKAQALRPGRAGDMFDLRPFGQLASLVTSNGVEHLLLSDGRRAVRLDAPRGSFTDGPVSLLYSVGGLVSAEPALLTLRRFLALCRAGSFARSLHRPEARARRWILILRAFDALQSGADQRLIAQELFSRSVAGPQWRSREPSMRSQAQRLVRAARTMAGGGYRRFLGAA